MSISEIHAIDFAARRKTFLAKAKGAVAVFPSAPELLRNNDVHHPYRQESNFFYLTGFDEPHSVCLLASNNKAPFQMFVHPKDKKKELWEGKILGPEGAKSTLGADNAFPSIPGTFFDDAFVEALMEADVLYYRVGLQPEFDVRIFSLMKLAARRLGRTGRPMWPIHDPDEILSDMRLHKSKMEVERLQAAARISAEAHTSAMRMAKPGMYEFEIEAVLLHSFRMHGSGRVGYSSIVASGPNACVLHYISNSRRMAQNDLLLIDAGAEFDYYTADITRVFPVGGTFSPEQREVYSSVLRAQKECIAMARPGKTMKEIHAHAVEVLTEELKRLKILKGTTQSLIKKKAYFPYFPHGTGHWLGMDVHDVGRYYNGNYESARKLEPGHCFTVEPGLYFGDSNAPAKYRGIGVRIEDDILITSPGCKVLTHGVPKEIDEVESICMQV